MSEETTAPAEAQDTPPIAAPDEPTTGEGHAEINYETRYNDLRSEFDRKNGLLARAQQGDIEALIELGVPIDTGEDDGDEEFDPEALTYDPEALQAYIAQQVQQGVREALTPFEQQQQEQQVELASATALHDLPGFADYAPEDQDTIWELAKALPRTPDGLYDVQTAFSRLTGVVDRRLASYADSKQRAPRVTPGGQAATEVPDLDDEAARQRYMTEKFQERSQG